MRVKNNYTLKSLVRDIEKTTGYPMDSDDINDLYKMLAIFGSGNQQAINQLINEIGGVKHDR